MRRIGAKAGSLARRTVMRFTSLARLCAEWDPGLSWLVPVSGNADLAALDRLGAVGLTNLCVLTENELSSKQTAFPTVVACAEELELGDVVAITPGRSMLQVLYRESDMHHTVFLTNRCNSRCIMCSQPPSQHDDSWLVQEAKQVAAHMRNSPGTLGFTGGEPLLLREALREILDAFRDAHSTTHFDVLTNGRLFSDRLLAERLLTGLQAEVTWMVPLYGHADFLHDQVVQADGAFNETIDGLLTLQEFAQPIQLRIVLVEPVLRVLPEMCAFIARNLPFVREVALMGCEPIGYAVANREMCAVDLADWNATLKLAVNHLSRSKVPSILMNIPLCALSSELRAYAHRSISDWKQIYALECDDCRLRANCCGLFASTARAWRPTVIRPIKEVA